MVAFHTVKPGDTLYEVRRERTGNTTMSRSVCRPIYIVEVHENHVMAKWNGNPARRFGEMTEAEIDNLLDLLDLFGKQHGDVREQSCFQAARAIRGLRAEVEQMIDDAHNAALERNLLD